MKMSNPMLSLPYQHAFLCDILFPDAGSLGDMALAHTGGGGGCRQEP